MLFSAFQAQNDIQRGEDGLSGGATGSDKSIAQSKTKKTKFLSSITNAKKMMSLMKYNDSLLMIALANNTLLPMCYSSKTFTDGDNIRQLADICPKVSRSAKPFLCYLSSKEITQ